MNPSTPGLRPWIELLRWNKPSGRLILLIPAGWSLWLTPSAPPSASLVGLILVGGLAVSGAGCIANDLWDQRFDRQVERTQARPLARGALQRPQALSLLIVLLLISLGVVLSLSEESRGLCLSLALAALPPILLYPSAKRWFAFPQAILALLGIRSSDSMGSCRSATELESCSGELLDRHHAVDLWIRHGLCHGGSAR